MGIKKSEIPLSGLMINQSPHSLPTLPAGRQAHSAFGILQSS
jgi:hypothetical protein